MMLRLTFPPWRGVTGTLTRILEALDYRVNELKVNRLNPGMNTRFWTQKDVTRSKEFITAIEATVSVHRSSIRFTINKKKVSLDVDIFRNILQFCPKILGQVFEDLPLEQDILSFIRDLRHIGDITYLTDVNVDS
ncbi:hypothetical protein Tco_0246158 [Tanacetum coccineum]